MPVMLPFTYTLYDRTFLYANIGTNGTIQFVGNNTSHSNTALPANGSV